MTTTKQPVGSPRRRNDDLSSGGVADQRASRTGRVEYPERVGRPPSISSAVARAPPMLERFSGMEKSPHTGMHGGMSPSEGMRTKGVRRPPHYLVILCVRVGREKGTPHLRKDRQKVVDASGIGRGWHGKCNPQRVTVQKRI